MREALTSVSVIRFSSPVRVLKRMGWVTFRSQSCRGV